MYEFSLGDFLSNVLICDGEGAPSIETTVVIDGSNENEVACAACSFLSKAFDFLNAANSTNVNYTTYYTINPDTGSGPDEIIMIESGIMDSPYLKDYVTDNYIYDNVGG